MVSGLSRDPFSLGDKYGPPATEFLAQPQTFHVFLGLVPALLGPSGQRSDSVNCR